MEQHVFCKVKYNVSMEVHGMEQVALLSQTDNALKVSVGMEQHALQ
jgi:hypothetical protein